MIRVLALLGLTACFVGGVLTYLLLPEPFGLLFSSSLVLAVIGLVALLGAAGLRLVRSRRRWTRSLALLPLLSAMAVVAAAAAVASDVRVLVFRGLPPHPTAAQWQEDLDYLADRMVALHPNLYGMVSQQRFDSVVAATRAAIPTQTAEATLMALFRVVALPNDAHTFPFLFIPAFDLHPFPLQAYTFDDGPYVVRAGRDYRETIGSRVIAVSGVPIAELYEGFAPYISAENEVGRLDRWTGLPLTEWLAARGLGGTNGAVVTLERPDGTRYDAAVRPVGLLPFGYWAYARQVARTSSPAVSGDRREAFWFEYDEPTESLYFDFNQSLPVWNGDSLRTVLAELDAFLDAHPCDRFIVDLRNNGGGDLGPARDVATFIAGDDRIDRRGRLFVLIGRRTFSAGAVAAALLRNTTTAVLLGEPTGQGSVFYAGPTIVTLPHSRLPIAISTRQTVGTLADEPGDRVAPDVPVPYTHEDFFAGRDPVREAALAHEAPSLATTHLDARTLTALTGRYRYSTHQLAKVTRDGDQLQLEIDDFIPTSLARLRAALYPTSGTTFVAGVPGIRVAFPLGTGAADMVFEWDDARRVVPRLPDEYQYPLELLLHGAIVDGVAAVLRDSAYYATAVPGFEAGINQLGYRYLRDGATENAIAVFQLNVALFPESANAYDSLGEGYLVRGDTALAITHYRRAVALEPDSRNAREVLARLGG
jgi:hypothetical protein